MESSGETRIGPYRVLRSLGKGGMGEVLLAYDPRLDRQVAIKRIRSRADVDETNRARFLREARVAAGLNHPAVAQVFDLLSEEGDDFIVMEYVPGETLRHVLRDGPLAVGRGIAIARVVAEGLAYAHRRGVVHRDLKTENILLTPEGGAKIVDFGIARRLMTDPSQGSGETLTREGLVIGTCRAMSPEQVQGEKVDARSDLFSFGVLLYEAFTGTSPFQAKTDPATLARILNHRQPPAHEVAPGVPPAISALIDHLLAKDPALRPRDAGEIAERLFSLEERATLETAAIAAVPPVASRPEAAATRLDARLPGERRGGKGPAAGEHGDESFTVASFSTGTARTTAERRQVTVLCCDVVRAGETAGALDAETLFEIMPAFQALVRECVEVFEGHMGNALGHRLVVYFGYPQAHEDDARRAVYAAQRLVDRVGRMEAEEDGSGGFAARAGIHTGLAVVVPGEAGPEPLTLGLTLDLTTGIQGRAGGGDVMVSEATRRLVGDYFTFEDLEAFRFPGLGEAVGISRVTAAREMHSRVVDTASLEPMIARGRELELLLGRWELVRRGSGQVVLLGGEAGIGKSRLVRELRQRLAPEEPLWLIAYGSASTSNSPLHPVGDLLRRLFGIASQQSAGEQQTRIEEELAAQDLPASEMVPVLAPLLGLPSPEGDPAPELGPEKLREQTLETLLGLILGLAERRPVVLAVEDLHWMDPTTLELLGLLLDQGTAVSLFTLLTFRLGFEPPWPHRAHLTQLSLDHLTGPETEALIDRVAAGRSLPAELRREIVAKTDGVPLFVEELTKAVLESAEPATEGGTTSSEPRPMTVPATLRDSLTARLDRLGTAREVAQLAAVVGRRFPFALLAAVSPLSEEGLQQELDRLVGAGLLQRRGLAASRAVYTIKHALIQDAAYESLLAGHRKRLHLEIAHALEQRFPERAESEPEVLARHFDLGGESDAAARAWQRAGERAAARWAHAEAIHHFGRVRELLAGLPPSTERSRRELEALSSLGMPLIATRGYGADEVKQTYTRAWQLCEELGDTPLPVRYGIWAVHIARGDRQDIEDMAVWFEGLLERSEDADALLIARNCLGLRALYRGRYAVAGEHLERAVELFDAARQADLVKTYGGCGGFYGHLLTIWWLWFTGRPQEARDQHLRVLAQAEEMGEPYTLATAASFGISMGFERRDPEAVEEAAERVAELSQERSFFWLAAIADVGRGWALARRGKVEEGLERMRSGLGVFRLTGIRLLFPYYSSCLVETLLAAGRSDEGLAAVEEALAMSRSNVDSFYTPDLLRLLGELLDGAGRGEDGERELRAALELAREEGSRPLELRAALSLGRVLGRRGDTAEAGRLLGRALGGFAEGAETADLAAARKLQSELQAAAEG